MACKRISTKVRKVEIKNKTKYRAANRCFSRGSADYNARKEMTARKTGKEVMKLSEMIKDNMKRGERIETLSLPYQSHCCRHHHCAVTTATITTVPWPPPPSPLCRVLPPSPLCRHCHHHYYCVITVIHY